MTASRTPSEIWSATLSGWPSVTDSEVNRYSFSESGWFIGSGDAPRVGFRREGSGSAPHRSPCLPAFFLAPVIIDHERDALQPVALAQPVLEEEAVVAREKSLVGHLDREARRARLELRHVEEPHPPAAHCGRLTRRLDVRDEAVELGGGDARPGSVGQVECLGHEPLHSAAGLRGYRHHLGPQAQS